VPVVSAFFGIIVRMFYNDHEPPHIHVEHQGDHAKMDFAGNVMAGQLGPAVVRRLRDWTRLYRSALESNWKAIKAGKPLERIPSLP
jgi:Domain of unknown function (DUF4160)